jgi:ABC-2 type transport system ATP-binding protein
MSESKKREILVAAIDIGKRFGDFIALHPLNVKVQSGEFFGVFGPNGAGKSTFIKLLTGQLKPSIGEVEVLGIDVKNNPQELKANIGIVPESESPPSYLTPVEFLELASAFIHEPRLMFLDEPFANLDPIYQRKCRTWLLDMVAEGGTIFMCSHVLEVAERLCTRLAIIDHGKVLASGKIEDLKASDGENLEDVFIRLVGHSMAEAQGMADGDIEEE